MVCSDFGVKVFKPVKPLLFLFNFCFSYPDGLGVRLTIAPQLLKSPFSIFHALLSRFYQIIHTSSSGLNYRGLR